MSKRTLLFMPGNNPGMLISADVLGADMAVFDLEDAVSLDEKDAARTLVRNALKTLNFAKSEVGVRVNPTDSPYWEEDLEAIVPMAPDAIVIPKASVESVIEVENRIEEIRKREGIEKQIPTFLLIESAMSIMTIMDICRASKLFVGLILGGEDYSSSMGIERSAKSKELEYARFTLATAARAFEVDGIDTPYTDIENIEGLMEDTKFSKSIGLSGRLLISPRHVRYVHQVLSPTEKEIEEATEILAENERAKAEGLGVFSYKGKMVDAPVIKRAENTVRNAKNWGLI